MRPTSTLDAAGTHRPILIDGRYELVEVRGVGGMAKVWRAHDVRLDRDVAVKLFSGSAELDDAHRRRIEREARALAALEHPNIVAVYDYGEDTTSQDVHTPYIVMELVNGPDLQQKLDADGPLDIEVARSLLVGILHGIERAHGAGIVHGDVKPANVLLAAAGPKVGDFGVARILDHETGMTTAAATPRYAAPEVLRGAKPTAASDVYSVACVAFQMLTGRAPYEGNNAWEVAAKHIEDPLPSVRGLRSDVPVSLDEIIRRAMQKDAASRPRIEELVAGIGMAASATVPLRDQHAAVEPREATELLPSDIDVSKVALWGPFAMWGSKLAGRLRRGVAGPHRRRRVALAAVGVVVLIALFGGRSCSDRGIQIPDVRGRVTSDASTTLRKAGFVVSDISYEPVSSGQPDRVLKTIPATGAVAGRGSGVHIVSSALVVEQPTPAPAPAPAGPRGHGKGAKQDEG